MSSVGGDSNSSLEASTSCRLSRLEMECAEVVVGLKGVTETCDLLQATILGDRQAGQGENEGLQALLGRLLSAETRLDKFLLHKTHEIIECDQLKINLVTLEGEEISQNNELLMKSKLGEANAENTKIYLKNKITKLENSYRQMQLDMLSVVEHCEEFEKDFYLMKSRNLQLCAIIEALNAEKEILRKDGGGDESLLSSTIPHFPSKKNR